MPGPIHLGGLGNIAASALDIAVWDLAGKAAGLPLYRLLGGYRDRVPAYVSLRMRREYPLADLPGIASTLAEQGHRAMKMNLGGERDVHTEVERVRAVRQAIGPRVRLLADANFRWTPSHAIRVAHAIEELNLDWLEDPVPTHDLPGLAEVRRSVNVPIANGEALTTLVQFRPLFEAGAVDFPMPDLARVGGITPFVKIAHLAEAFSLPICCHLLPEISAQVLAAVSNGHIAEYVPWAWRVFDGCPEVQEGNLVMSERPGTGLTLNKEALAQYAVR
jgi:L-alanine-DL-glutamate epimerase-like enolase superfamily enzyme